jgi:UPF0716 protein FxsA
MAGSHLIRRIGRLRSGLAGSRDAAGDGAVTSLATVLVLIPGLVSTALGLVLLIPPVRSAAGPGLGAMAVRTLRRRVPGISYATTFRADPYPYPGDARGHGDYIDGEVIDVKDVEPARTPRFDGR